MASNEPSRPAAPAAVGEGAPSAGGRASGVAVATLPLRGWRPVRGAAVGPPPAAAPAPVAAAGAAIAGTSGALQPLAQYADTYILAADERGLLIVDQHVAHERILFEEVLERQRAGRLAVQRLLVPETFDLEPEAAAAAETYAELLASFGFEMEPFGGATWAVRSVPELLGARRAEASVRALLAELAECGRADTVERMQREVAASIACHAAVRANQPLAAEAQARLLADLARCEVPNRCPHGRPIMLRVTHEQIEKLLWRH